MSAMQTLTQLAGSRLALAGRALAVLCAVVLCVLLLGGRISDIRVSDVLAAMAAMPLGACVAALVFGILSHVAVAGYDLLAFTRIGRHVPWPRALAGGFAGTVMSESLGFGVVTGSLTRARIYRANGIGATGAVALSGLVAAGFFSGLGVLLSVLLLADPGVAASVTGLAPGAIRGLAAAGLAVFCAAALFGTVKPYSLKVGKLSLKLPDAKWLGKSTLLAAADLVPAALCLAVMLPEGSLPPLPAFVAIYIAGLALGYLIGSPGAAGPFEGVLFLALPAVTSSDLAAGILMYRLIYYLPAFAAALPIIARAPPVPRRPLHTGAALRDRIAWTMDDAVQAEAELALLGDKHVYFPEDEDGFVFYGISGRIWLVMGDPVGPRDTWEGLIAGLETEARAAGATLAIYKAPHASHSLWQARGYHLQPLGDEAALCLADWKLDGSPRRELRRKIRSAQKAGVTLLHHPPGAHPVDEMAEVARAWHDAKGREQSFSMGHWDPAFNSRHDAVSAWRDDRMIAFATFWISGDGSEWMLDLMRQVPDAPNGTIYAILAEAIAVARESGAASFNLCLAPLSGLNREDGADRASLLSRLGHRIYDRLNHRHGLQGMRRFKDVFRPDWTARYLAVPSRLALPEALLAAYRLVQSPGDVLACETPRTPWLRPLAGPSDPDLLDPDDTDTQIAA